MKRNKLFKLSLIFSVVILVLAACGTSESDSKSTKAEEDSSENTWLDEANLEESETVEELYEKAKEEGKVVVYSTSSVINNVKEDFEKEYPGITVEATKVNGVQLLEKLKREQEGGIYSADVIYSSDGTGAFEMELRSRGGIHHYKPEILANDIIEPYRSTPELGMAVSLQAIYYNTDAYDESPITNWWDLTTPEWKGKVLAVNPLENESIKAQLLAFIRYSDDMEEAYKERFGEEIVLNGTENAGYEYVKRLIENDLIIMSSTGEAVDGVVQSTQENPPIAIGSTTKLRDIETQDAKINVAWDIKPKFAVSSTKNLWIADQAPNINAAKLLVRWMSGGDGGKGFEPLNTPGTWPTVDGISVNEDIVKPLNEIDLWPEDHEFFHEESSKLEDFIIKIQ